MSEMKIALGLKAHSGWAALVAVGMSASGFQVVDRQRVSLVEEETYSARQPYHAAENLDPASAETLVRRFVEAARRAAMLEIKRIGQEYEASQRTIQSVAVLVPSPMPEWSIAEILAVHFRMHKAEGLLFPDALCRAARACDIPLFEVREKQLWETAESSLEMSTDGINGVITALGKTVGPPWAKDQKTATMAAVVALSENLKGAFRPARAS